MDKIQIGQIIQLSLTPGIMISSSALFLLGLQNRFSNLFARFRALNQERRVLEHSTSRTSIEEERLKNLILQLGRLMDRVYAVKNAILCFYIAILCFITTSLLLLFSHYFTFLPMEVDLCAFFIGMLFILAACVFMIREIILAFRILALERHS